MYAVQIVAKLTILPIIMYCKLSGGGGGMIVGLCASSAILLS